MSTDVSKEGITSIFRVEKRRTRNQLAASHLAPAARWFLARMVFGPEDRGNSVHRKVALHTDYWALYPKKMAKFIATALRTNQVVVL
jgi:hypothetical protein